MSTSGYPPTLHLALALHFSTCPTFLLVTWKFGMDSDVVFLYGWWVFILGFKVCVSLFATCVLVNFLFIYLLLRDLHNLVLWYVCYVCFLIYYYMACAVLLGNLCVILSLMWLLFTCLPLLSYLDLILPILMNWFSVRYVRFACLKCLPMHPWLDYCDFFISLTVICYLFDYLEFFYCIYLIYFFY